MRSPGFLEPNTELLKGNEAVPFDSVVDMVRWARLVFGPKDLHGHGVPIFAPLPKTGLMGPQCHITGALLLVNDPVRGSV